MKRVLSAVLSLSMIASMIAVPAKAEMNPVPLEASRIDSDKLPEGNLIYMGTAATSVVEGDAVYSFPIYREGDLSGEASVTIHTLDMTAVYGKDYELLSDDVEKTGDGVSLLERYAKAKTDDNKDDSEIPQIEDNLSENEAAEFDSEIYNQIAEEIVPQAMADVEYSSTSTVTFADGEDEKIVCFKILDDNKSEGNEAFSMLLVEPENAELYEITSLSVNIEDDEPKERSVVSFTKSKYNSKDGKATITIKRSGAEYSLCDFALLSSGITAIAGENYEEQNGTVAFMPYETEKTIEIPVSGEGEFKLLMRELTGCDEGKHTETVVTIKETADSSLLMDSDQAYLMGNEQNSFTARISNKDYTVEYKMPSDNNKDPSSGTIYATNYDMRPKVGKYYFATSTDKGGIFHYGNKAGDKPWGCGFWKSEYIMDTSVRSMDASKHFGKLEYYHTSIWRNGETWTYSNSIPSVYYQYVTPDWTSAEGAFGGQCARFIVKENGTQRASNDKTGKFGRTLDEASVKLMDGSRVLNGAITMEVHSVDEDSGKTPKNYVWFYGIAAMYKRFNIQLYQPAKMSYELASDDVYPMQFKLDSGAQISGSETRDFWANENEDDSNIVFTIKDTDLNGHKGKYGYVKGYKIDIDPGNSNDKVSLNYPEDFVSYLNSKKGTKLSDEVNFTSDNVEKEIKKTERQNLYYIPCDKYFISWIESKQKKVVSDGYGYYQKLKITPKIEYVDVKVEILEAAGEGGGSFKDSNLTPGKTATYHAGDTLDLSATANDSDHHVVGYQVSVDNVNFNTITDTDKLFLEADKKYRIRPLIAKNTNKIEIKFKGGAENYLSVQGLITKNDIENCNDKDLVRELSGKYILNVAPEKPALSDKITPVAGQIYTLNFTCTEDSTYIYRPVITQGNDTFVTNVYHTTAQSQTADNVITVNYKKVKKSDLKTFYVSGRAVSKNVPIRSTGLKPEELPLVGYTVSAGKGTQVENKSDYGSSKDNPYLAEGVSGTTRNDGSYELQNISGSSGDYITLYISNGVTNGYVAKVMLSDAISEKNNIYKVNAGNTNITYPYGAPKVSSLMYTYDKNTADYTQNQIRILDDNLTITAVIDGYGRSVSEAIFTVRTSTGQTTEYKGTPTSDGSSIIECKINKMTENLHSADSISVRLVDSEKIKLDGGNEIDIVYPDVSTGLSFYTENALTTPQTYDFSNSPTINIPLIGSATGVAKSGLLTFGKTKWQNGMGYTIQVNVDASINNKGTKSTKEKADAYNKLINSAKRASETKQNATTVLNEVFGNTAPVRSSYQTDRDYEVACENYAKTLRDSKNPMAGFNNNIMSVEVAIVLAFDFVKTPDNDYIFACGAVAVGGAYNFNKTMYSSIYGVPVFLNIQAGLQVNAVVSYATEAGQNAITAGEFDAYQGNIADMLSSDEVKLSVVISGKVQVGVGMCGVIAARGYVSLTFQFDIYCVNPDGGALISAAGGIGLDLLLMSLNIDVAKYTQGWGTLEKAGEMDFFNDLLNVSLSDYDDDVEIHEYNAGSADMSSFGKNGGSQLMATEKPVSYEIIQSDAAERTRPHIIPLDGGKKMITFIGNGSALGTSERDENNAATLFYSVYDGAEWSAPQAVADDGTVDANSTVKKIGNKVLIVWTDSERELSENESSKDKLSSIGLSCAIYDTETGVMGDEIDIVHDEYMTASPQINVDEDMLYVSYMKHDLSAIGDSNSDLLNLDRSFIGIAAVKYDISNGTRYDEEVISIQHENIDPPVVLDYKSVITKIDNDSYMISCYTIDEDEDFQTGDDRELYMCVRNLTTDKIYFPIRITDDDVAASTPMLTDINGKIYLTWINNGYLFNLMNVTDMLTALFDEDVVNTAYKDGAMTSALDRTNVSWYKKTAAELGMSEEVYENSIYESIANGNFNVTSANFQSNDNLRTNVGNYIVTTNGDDIYIYYTQLSQEQDNNGIEIYGVRYKCGGAADGEVGEWKFGKAVQITDFGMVIDELDLYMTEDNRIYAVSNFYKQWIDENDADEPIKYSSNKLAGIEFEPVISLDIANSSIILPSKIYPGYAEEIVFEIANKGLLDAAGYKLDVTDNKGNTIYSDETNTVIEAGTGVTVNVPWTVPDDPENMEITATVTELGLENSTPVSVTKAVPYDTRLNITDFEISHDGIGYYACAAITNNGSKPSEETEVTLVSTKNGEDCTVFGATSVPSLAGGESKDITIPFSPSADEFNHLGYIDLKLTAVSGDNTDNAYTKFVSNKPIVVEINGGEENISLKGSSDTITLQTVAAPWGSYAGEVTYYSDDNGVAVVKDDGTVVPTGNGEAKIYAYYSLYGIGDSINVQVTGIKETSSTTSHSGGGGGGSSTDYSVSLSKETYDNGKVTLSRKSASKGETVIITTAPDAGYELDTITVTDADGNVISLTKNSPNEYSFVMPASKISVDVTYKKADTAPQPSEEKVLPFGDVPESAWYYEPIKFAYDNGLMSGISETEFAPETDITRGMFVTVLYRMDGEPDTAIDYTFSDVDRNAYYAKAVAWGRNNNIIAGYSDTQFAPDDKITREQMAAILWRYAEYKGMDISQGAIPEYTDAADISEYAVPAVRWTCGSGIINGFTDNTLRPKATATRAQAAAVFGKIYNMK